ncbi:MAG: hypothetical protein AAGG75_12210 [Bacteroidota bacterium]
MTKCNTSVLRLLICAVVLLLFSSCEKAILDKPFSELLYEQNFNQLYGDKEIGVVNAFFINYAVVRYRDYYGYEVQDKTYGEILDMANDFKANGFPVKDVLAYGIPPESLEVKPFNEGVGQVRKGNSSRIRKVFKFSCKYTNKGDQPLVLSNSSFVLKGPFQDLLTVAGYELNCLIKGGETISVNFLVDAKIIRDNIVFRGNPKFRRVLMNDLLNFIEIVPGGNTVVMDTQYYEECQHAGARIEPFRVLDYTIEDYKALYEKVRNGELKEIDRGPAHFELEESDEPVQIYR